VFRALLARTKFKPSIALCAREVLGNHRRQAQQSRLELGAVSQRLIPTGERLGLWTRIAVTESISSCARMKAAAFLELEVTIQTPGELI